MKRQRILPRSLMGRSLLILILPIVLVQVVTGYMFFDRHWGRVIASFSEGVASEIAYVAEDIVANGQEAEGLNRALDKAQRIFGFETSIVQAWPVDRQHSHEIFWEKMVASIFEPILEQKLSMPFIIDMDFAHKQVHVWVQVQQGSLYLKIPERRLFSSSAYIYLLWVMAAAIILLWVATLFMRNQVRPIRKLAQAAERFGRGQGLGAFRPQGAREVRKAGRAFIDMAERIQRQVQQRTLMLAGISHDLRTPLTRFKLALSMLPHGPDTEAMNRDVAEMKQMIDGYLSFVQGAGEEEFSDLPLAQVLEGLAQEIRTDAFDIQIECPETLSVYLRSLAFSRVLRNVLSNAQRYAHQALVVAQMDVDQDVLEITIEDDGPGLPEDDYEEALKPFVRMEEGRTIQDGNVGLGLPIALDIVHSHGGKLVLEKSQRFGGLCVRILLPQ